MDIHHTQLEGRYDQEKLCSPSGLTSKEYRDNGCVAAKSGGSSGVPASSETPFCVGLLPPTQLYFTPFYNTKQ